MANLSDILTNYQSVDTLDSVTDRGATTTNNLTIGTVTTQGTTNEVISVNSTANGSQINFNSATSSQDWVVGISNDTTDDFLIYQSGAGTGDIRLYTDGVERLTALHGGNVGIGTSDPVTALEVEHGFDAGTATSRPAIVTDGSYGGGIALEDGTQECGFYATSAGANLHIYTYRTVGSDTAQSAVRGTFNQLGDLTLTRNLVVGSGNGIDFSASGNASGMTSELLDDYEEGTFTPTFEPTAGSFAGITYSTQIGHYTKIGNLVSVGLRISVSSLSQGTASGYLTVRNLPFTSNGSAYSATTIGYSSQFSTNYPSGGDIGRGTAYCYLYTVDATNTSGSCVPSNLTGTSHLYMSLTYYAV